MPSPTEITGELSPPGEVANSWKPDLSAPTGTFCRHQNGGPGSAQSPAINRFLRQFPLKRKAPNSVVPPRCVFLRPDRGCSLPTAVGAVFRVSRQVVAT